MLQKRVIPCLLLHKGGLYKTENFKKPTYIGDPINAIKIFNEKEVLENKKPILGICLGMQLLTNSSEEGKEKGLCWIDAQTIKFDLEDKSLSIPHMGWNKTNPTNTNNIFKNLEDNRFYFVHSYHVVCNNEENILATANYGKIFTCSIYKDNIYGVQFHPEKSHKFGMQLLKNFGEM